MNKVLIVPAGWGQVDLIKYFKYKKFKTFTLDDDDYAIGHKFSDFRLKIKSKNISKIKKYVKKENLKVTSTASDFGFNLKNKILFNSNKAKKLNNLLNKYLQKKRWKKIERNTQFYELKDFKKKFLKNNFYVLKPKFGAGSNDIFLIKNNKNLNNILEKKLDNKYFIEKFIPGNEYIVDGYKSKDKIIIFLIAKKKKLFFSVSNVIFNHDLDNDVLFLLKEKLKKFINLMDYPDGPFHSEFIINRKKIDLVECHPRAIGYNIYNIFINKLYGVNMYDLEMYGLNTRMKKKFNKMLFSNFCIRFFDIKKDGKLKNIKILKKKFKNIQFLTHLYFKKNDLVKFSKTDTSRFGYVFALSNDKLDLVKITKKFQKNNFIVQYY